MYSVLLPAPDREAGAATGGEWSGTILSSAVFSKSRHVCPTVRGCHRQHQPGNNCARQSTLNTDSQMKRKKMEASKHTQSLVPVQNSLNIFFKHLQLLNIARVRNCPDIAISNSLFGHCLFVFLSFCLSVFWSLCLNITLIKCLKGLKSQQSLFVLKF